MTNQWLAIAAALSLLVAPPTAAADRPGLAPSVPWTVEYDDDSCALRRMFGAGKDQAYLEFRRFGPGLDLQTIIGSNRMRPNAPVGFRYRFASDADWSDVVGGNTVTLDNGFDGVLFSPVLASLPELEGLEDPLERAAGLAKIDIRPIEREVAASTDTLSLRGAFRNELSLQIGPLDAPITALNKCIDELMTHWGIDVEAHKTLTRPAVPINLPEVGGMIDYPPKMLQKRLQGVVNIRLDIDAAGLITGCHIQMPLSDPAFERTSCIDVQHAIEFEPALDKDGKPIASYWITKIYFLIG